MAPLAVLAIAGCKFPYPPDVVADGGGDAAVATRAIGGSVTGLWTGGAVTLHLQAGDVTDDVAAAATEPFTFADRLPDGASYLVTVADDGPEHDCAVTNGSGRVDGADIDDLVVACTNLIPHGIVISTAVSFTFDPRVTRYELPVSVLQQETTVVVTGPSLTSATVAGEAVGFGQPSPTIALGPGQTTVPVVVAKGALSRRYELVFDRGAAPIVEAMYGRASNAEAEDVFGSGVAAAGDLVAIGAPGEDGALSEGNDNNSLGSGAVYAFHRSGATWTQTQLFRGLTVSSLRNFGGALAMDGDVLVVGARREGSAGAAYVFRFDHTSGRWNQQQKLTASDPHTDDQFGSALTVSGDRLAVGARGHDGGVAGSNRGLVYVYRWDGTRWSEEARVSQPSPQAGDQLGGRMTMDGDTLVVGRGTANDVYHRSGTTWSREGQLPGGPIDVEGDVVVVGQPQDASGNGQPGDQSAPASGAVRVFMRTGTIWNEVAYLKASPPQAGAMLGTGVALRANVIIASAAGTHTLHPFERVGGTWVAVAPLRASGGITADFGGGIALTGVGAVIGAIDDAGPGGSTPDSGAAWFFR